MKAKTASIVLVFAATALQGGAVAATPHAAYSAGSRVWSPTEAARGKKHGKRHGRSGRSEVLVIRDYYATRGLPPGLANRRALPPGLRRQLAVGGRLPPGLEKRLYAVPSDLVVVLPRLPYYQRRFFLGADLLVVDTRRNVVVSVVADVLR